jgi:DNA-binding PadR family transcriptional regulator
MTASDDDIDALLPLTTAAFHILLALSAEDRHGYGIIHDVATRTGGALRLSPGTLYRTIQDLLERGLIDEPGMRSRADRDPRRRYYRITAFGTAVARAETRRLEALVRLARSAWSAVPQSS